MLCEPHKPKLYIKIPTHLCEIGQKHHGLLFLTDPEHNDGVWKKVRLISIIVYRA